VVIDRPWGAGSGVAAGGSHKSLKCGVAGVWLSHASFFIKFGFFTEMWRGSDIDLHGSATPDVLVYDFFISRR